MGENQVQERVARLEEQMKRFISDMESEKGTRARANTEVLRQLEQVKKIVWIGVGVGLTLNSALVVALLLKGIN